MKNATFRSTGMFMLLICLVWPIASPNARAQQWLNTDDDSKANRSIFRTIDEWPDPSDYRNAAGAPGIRYWQQQVDYVIEAELDDINHVVSGSEHITYFNNSPDALRYLWVQLDQNVRSLEHSRTYRAQAALPENINPRYARYYGLDQFDGGHKISRVQLVNNQGDLVDARFLINDTIMKVNLDEPLTSGETVELEIDWSFRVPDSGRGAKEEMQDGWLYVVAQWFPRMSVYDDVNGWQTDQFLGRGEFYLNFGDYDVKLTVPYDHIVDATGVLQNPEDVLTETQQNRLEQAYLNEEPTFIVAADEVLSPEIRPTRSGTLTWHFKAEDVRDFAWASSKAFVWDAAGYRYDADEEPVQLHSLYPREAMPLWDKVSTRAILQTIVTYGRMSLKYPYPKAVNVNGPVGGMEYPMVAFCGARPAPDGTYSDRVERSLIGVTIHEVGHNWVPMIIASDERKWTWMDEGLNTFLQYYGQKDYARKWAGTPIGEQFVDGEYPGGRGEPTSIVDYMRSPIQVPIMTHSDLIPGNTFGNNGYAKPATGLVILREKVLGPERFDDAFREYSQLWAFKHPQPTDFFRTMDEAAGEDLAWFWRGWFYTTHANDQAVENVTEQAAEDLIGSADRGQHYYRIQVDNKGGLVMPLEMEVTYDDGSTERFDLPVEIWKTNEVSFTKGFFSDRGVVKVVIDPDEMYADIDRENNVWEASFVEEGEEVNQ